MTRRNQIGIDARLEVVDRRIDARLHRLTGQMIAPQNDVDAATRKVRLHTQADIYDPCVRASRKNGYASASYVGRDKPLVHDQRIGLPLLTIKAMMADEAGFIFGDPRNSAAGEEKAVA